MQFIKIIKISGQEQLQSAYKIRKKVFVEEQNVPVKEEIDEFEKESFHFLAYVGSEPAGTARWRFTPNGIKLERFAVRKNYRGLGVGFALVEAVLDDVKRHPESDGKKLYLHAQLGAVSLYEKFGFVKEGEIFQECKIDHYKMVYNN